MLSCLAKMRLAGDVFVHRTQHRGIQLVEPHREQSALYRSQRALNSVQRQVEAVTSAAERSAPAGTGIGENTAAEGEAHRTVRQVQHADFPGDDQWQATLRILADLESVAGIKRLVFFDSKIEP